MTLRDTSDFIQSLASVCYLHLLAVQSSKIGSSCHFKFDRIRQDYKAYLFIKECLHVRFACSAWLLIKQPGLVAYQIQLCTSKHFCFEIYVGML